MAWSRCADPAGLLGWLIVRSTGRTRALNAFPGAGVSRTTAATVE
jgi:hypothetical protein